MCGSNSFFSQAKPEPGQLRLSGILRIMVALMGVFGAKYTEKELRCCIDVVKRATSERWVDEI